MSPSNASKSQRPAQGGFALVIALSLMAFVLLLLLSITTLVQVETQGSQIQLQQMEAEQSALLGLQIALGELQKTAGLDQRVTATAEVLNDSRNLYTGGTTPVEGQGSWTGVWKSDTVSTGTPSYSPADPNQREFIGWLVSSANAAGELELPTTLDAIESTPLNSVILAKDSSDKAYATVGKVEVDSTSRNQIAFAFMVEDESVKADLSWSEHSKSATSAERYQTGRLAAAPGPDYGALNGSSATGPFDSVIYPLSSDSTSLISDGILKLSSVASITSMMSSGADASDWLRDSRGDVTWGSRGVMADVKFGGLRRDLSLAFEMDGDADMVSSAIDQPTKFNQQVDEFVADVADKDRLSASGKPNGLPVYERFVYRDYKDASPATPFSSNIVSNSSEVRKRGPNWWALRDYANLYKRLSGTSGNYTLQARPHYPNKITEGRNYSEMFDTINSWADQWDHEQRTQSQGTFSGYIYRPAKPSYAPVTLGTNALLSLKGIPTAAPDQVQLAVAVDPIFYIWNPYNRKLQFEGLKIDLKNSFPGQYTIEITGNNAQTIKKYVRDLFRFNVNSGNRKFAFEVQDASGSTTITMEPGEVMAVTPTTANSGIATPGYFEGNDINNSGLVMTEIDGNNSNILIDATLGANEVSFGYSSLGGASTNRFYLNTSISNPTNQTITEEIQQSHYQIQPTSSGGYRTPGSDADGFIIPNSEFDASELLNGEKRFFGMLIHLMKPALFGGATGGPVDAFANPVEIFSRFNPAPMLMNKDFGFTACGINQFYGHIADDNANNLLNNYGFNFTGSGRNAFWGSTYQFGGSTSVPMSNIPTSPLISLAEFSHANLSTLASEPFHAVGNSWSSPFVTPTSPYQAVVVNSSGSASLYTAGDHSWLMNDALFDRYYLSGIAPEFTLSGGYSDGGNTLEDTLDKFFDNDTDPSTDYRDALANPVLRPYLPPGKLANDVVSELDAADGYKKMGAYSLIDGAFNVNSTSIPAWAAFLRSNRNLAVRYAQGSATDSPSNDTPFPGSASPSNPSAPGLLTTQAHWAGLARLDDGDITDLATRIVEQVKLRGPFMSLSDFVNHRMGALNDATSYTGALQAAIELTSINNTVQVNAGGAALDYSSPYIPGRPPTSTLKQSTTNIPGDLTQADLLLPLAPRLTARSDTFRIRSYGEVRSFDGNSIVSLAICEAIVQRVPEYVDPLTNAGDNEPWDQAINPVTLAQSSNFNDINKTFGRRFRVVQLRWLSPDEI